MVTRNVKSQCFNDLGKFNALMWYLLTSKGSEMLHILSVLKKDLPILINIPCMECGPWITMLWSFLSHALVGFSGPIDTLKHINTCF